MHRHDRERQIRVLTRVRGVDVGKGQCPRPLTRVPTVYRVGMVDSPDSGGVSERARRMVTESTIAPYILEHIQRSTEPRDPDYLCLAVAENHLMWDIISEKANAVRNVGPSAFGYEDMRGSVALRATLARFLGDGLFGCEVSADSIVVMAGAGSVVEALTWALVDPGGGVVIPTPSYAGYWNDIEARVGLLAVPAHTRPESDFRITEDTLTAAVDASTVPIGALLLTNPSNPLGRTLTDDEVALSIDWARRRGMPIIMNEVYGLSIHGDTPFRSAASLLGGIPYDVHFIWAFSKDFASSGLSGGVAVTSNRMVHDVLMQHLYFSAVSGDTQHLMVSMLDDRDWCVAVPRRIAPAVGEVIRGRQVDARSARHSVDSRRLRDLPPRRLPPSPRCPHLGGGGSPVAKRSWMGRAST
jgi:aspartate/methionine/tyrosine aminotransferase